MNLVDVMSKAGDVSQTLASGTREKIGEGSRSVLGCVKLPKLTRERKLSAVAENSLAT
jgi:hypothetical protein